MPKLQKNNLVAQANVLIEARHKITKLENLLFVAMVSLINPKDKEFLTFKVTIEEMARILDVHPVTARREFDKVTDKLMRRIIKIFTPNGWKKAQLVSHADIEGNMVSLRFHKRLKPYLLELKKSGNFTQYRLGQAVWFKSVHTLRMYQILKEYYSKKMYEFDFSLDDYRKMMLGEKSTSYPLYKNFRNKVLDVAQKELSEKDKTTGLYKSDLGFDLKTRRAGRKISHLIFTIKTQQTKPIPNTQEPKHPTNDPNTPQIIRDYEAIGIMRKMVQPYLEQRGEQALQNTLNKFHHDKKTGRISKNEQGYLAHLLRVNAGQETTQDKERQQQQQNKKRRKEKAAQEQALQVQFNQARETALKSFFNTVHEDEHEYIVADFEESALFETQIKKWLVLFDLYKTQGMQDPAIKNCFDTFIIDQYLDKCLNDFAQWKEKTEQARLS